MWAHRDSEQQEELGYQVTYHTYLASRGQLCYIHRVLNLWIVEQYVTSIALSFWFYWPFFNYVILTWERCQVLPTFPYCKRQKAGRGLGTRLLFCFRVASVLDEESLSLLAFVCSQHIAGHTEGWVLTKFDIHCVCSTTIYVVPQGQVTLWWAYIKEWCHLCTCAPYWGKPKASISTVNSISLVFSPLHDRVWEAQWMGGRAAYVGE